MECCGVAAVRGAPPLQLGPPGGLPKTLGFGVLWDSAGWRPCDAAGLSRRVCNSRAKLLDAGFRVCKSGGSGGARFPGFGQSGCTRGARRGGLMVLARAEEEDGNHGTEEGGAEVEVVNMGPPIIVKKAAVFGSTDFWLQVGIFVFTAGFVDAGFSGDWSRIGVLSKHTEEELQMAAIGVVPLAVTLIWSISERKKQLSQPHEPGDR